MVPAMLGASIDSAAQRRVVWVLDGLGIGKWGGNIVAGYVEDDLVRHERHKTLFEAVNKIACFRQSWQVLDGARHVIVKKHDTHPIAFMHIMDGRGKITSSYFVFPAGKKWTKSIWDTTSEILEKKSGFDNSHVTAAAALPGSESDTYGNVWLCGRDVLRSVYGEGYLDMI